MPRALAVLATSASRTSSLSQVLTTTRIGRTGTERWQFHCHDTSNGFTHVRTNDNRLHHYRLKRWEVEAFLRVLAIGREKWSCPDQSSPTRSSLRSAHRAIRICASPKLPRPCARPGGSTGPFSQSHTDSISRHFLSRRRFANAQPVQTTRNTISA